MAQVVEHLPSKYEVLNSTQVPSPTLIRHHMSNLLSKGSWSKTDSLHYYCNFLISLRLFQNKKEKILEGEMSTI
jgi:hypothetical protein